MWPNIEDNWSDALSWNFFSNRFQMLSLFASLSSRSKENEEKPTTSHLDKHFSSSCSLCRSWTEELVGCWCGGWITTVWAVSQFFEWFGARIGFASLQHEVLRTWNTWECMKFVELSTLTIVDPRYPSMNILQAWGNYEKQKHTGPERKIVWQIGSNSSFHHLGELWIFGHTKLFRQRRHDIPRRRYDWTPNHPKYLMYNLFSSVSICRADWCICKYTSCIVCLGHQWNVQHHLRRKPENFAESTGDQNC